MPDPPRVSFRLLDPPVRIVTGHRVELSGELHNHDDESWTVTVDTLAGQA